MMTNENLAIGLTLLCTAAVWAGVWLALAEGYAACWSNRLKARRLLTYCASAVASFGAACGAFLLSAALLIPSAANQPHENFARSVLGAAGAAVLLLYLMWVRQLLRKSKQRAHVATVAIPPPLPVRGRTPVTLPSLQARQAWANVQASKQQAWAEQQAQLRREKLQQKAAERKILAEQKAELLRKHKEEWQQQRIAAERKSEQRSQARRKALGMSWGSFYDERFFTHVVLWHVMLYLGIWGFGLYTTWSDWPWLQSLLFGFLLAGMAIAASAFALCFLLTSLLFLLPACLSVWVEGLLRIWLDWPCIKPEPEPASVSSQSKATECAGLMLLLGLWIGYSMGSDGD